MTEHASDSYCRQTSSTVSNLKSVCSYDRDAFLIRQLRIDGALQKIVPTSHPDRLLYILYYPVLAGYVGERGFYNTLQLD